MNPPQTSISLMGSLARAHITHGLRGSVLASFSKATFLMTHTGEMLWLACSDAPLHRRCMRLDFPLSRLPASTPFVVDGTALHLERLSLEFGRAREWKAPPADPARRMPAAGLSACVEEIFTRLDYSRARGFGAFIPDILCSMGLLAPPKRQRALNDLVINFARPLVMQMVQACLDHQYSAIPALSRSIIGLGQGLTPSGDDFLGGFLFCLHSLGSLYGDIRLTYPKIPLKDFAVRTHPISLTLINDLAAGHAIAPLHELFNGLVSGDSFASLRPSLLQLLRTGHSTGWDLLTGLLAGLLTACTTRLASRTSRMPAFQA